MGVAEGKTGRRPGQRGWGRWRHFPAGPEAMAGICKPAQSQAFEQAPTAGSGSISNKSKTCACKTIKSPSCKLNRKCSRGNHSRQIRQGGFKELYLQIFSNAPVGPQIMGLPFLQRIHARGCGSSRPVDACKKGWFPQNAKNRPF